MELITYISIDSGLVFITFMSIFSKRNLFAAITSLDTPSTRPNYKAWEVKNKRVKVPWAGILQIQRIGESIGNYMIYLKRKRDRNYLDLGAAYIKKNKGSEEMLVEFYKLYEMYGRFF